MNLPQRTRRPYERSGDELRRLGNYLAHDVPWFSRFTPAMQHELCRVATVAHYESGEWAWHQGQRSDSLLCVLRGTVSLWARPVGAAPLTPSTLQGVSWLPCACVRHGVPCLPQCWPACAPHSGPQGTLAVNMCACAPLYAFAVPCLQPASGQHPGPRLARRPEPYHVRCRATCPVEGQRRSWRWRGWTWHPGAPA